MLELLSSGLDEVLKNKLASELRNRFGSIFLGAIINRSPEQVKQILQGLTPCEKYELLREQYTFLEETLKYSTLDLAVRHATEDEKNGIEVLKVLLDGLSIDQLRRLFESKDAVECTTRSRILGHLFDDFSSRSLLMVWKADGAI